MSPDGAKAVRQNCLEFLSFDGDNRTPIARLPRPARRDVDTIRIWQFCVLRYYQSLHPWDPASAVAARLGHRSLPPRLDLDQSSGSLGSACRWTRVIHLRPDRRQRGPSEGSLGFDLTRPAADAEAVRPFSSQILMSSPYDGR